MIVQGWSVAALLVAAVLLAAIGLAHSWLGEIKLLQPLLAPEARTGMLAKSWFARRVLRFAWHITTLAWWGLAAILVALALLPGDAVGRVVVLIIAATAAISGLCILAIGRGRHKAWPFFLLIAGLAAVPLF